MKKGGRLAQRVDPVNQGISPPLTIHIQAGPTSSSACRRFHHFILFIAEAEDFGVRGGDF